MEKNTYFLKKPTLGSQRNSFAIVKKTHEGNAVKYSSFNNSQTKLLNTLYTSGKKSFDETTKEFKEIIKNLQLNEKKRRGDLIASDENHIVLNEYLSKKYPLKKRKNLHFESVLNESARSLKILGNKSILSMSPDEIQSCVDRLNPDHQKRYVSRLHSILKTMGRTDVELFYSKPRKRRVAHITQKDLKILTDSILKEPRAIAGITPKNFAYFVIALFCTGARIGEALAFEEYDLVKTKFFIKIKQQVRQDGTLSETKNRKERKAVVLPFGIEATEEWIKLDKSKFSRFQAAKYLTKKTQALFEDRNKHISLHGLRHSYAIHLLRVVETSLSNVASFIGDGISVTEEYYIDFIASDETIENVVKRMKA